MTSTDCNRRVLLCLAVAAVVVLLPATLVAQAPPTDLTGETCLGATATIDPDGPGPLPAQVYCVMNGRLGTNQALEMDDIDGLPPVTGNPASVADANLFAGGTANDPNLPAVAGATYIDWANLTITNLTGPGAAPLGSVENHRILDFTANSDFTMLRPQNDSCLNNGSVLPKEDFTQSYIANNNEFLYFAQERRTNNGNSVYYWLLTKKPVIVVTGGACGSNTRGQVQFNLTEGDVELLVNFPDSSDPASGGIFFRPYHGADSGYIPARDAVFHPNWASTLAPVHNIALNIVGDGDDSFGPWGGIDSQGNPVASGNYTTASLAEWAVDLFDLFSGSPLCGKQLFITGLSRASTGQVESLTDPSALKDIVGPKLYSFGAITANASLTPSCTLSFGFQAGAVGIDGVTPIPEADLTASWSCTDGDARGVTMDTSALSGTGTIPPGDRSPDTITCTVTVTDVPSGCTDDASAETVVLAPILVTIDPTPASLSCTTPGGPPDVPGFDNGNIAPGVTFAPTISGGDGVYALTWNVNGPNTATCSANAATCVVDIADNNFCARTDISLTVDDGNALCLAATSETDRVFKSTTFTILNNSNP